ncbi:hypothetical protein [Clostridium tetani]|uniref:hypothetical protein n=1 Tax=Clostridium tetani TaxID=1513 RepID=UPI000A8FBC88|nr:hypothetical protein [Clostridium tetani]
MKELFPDTLKQILEYDYKNNFTSIQFHLLCAKLLLSILINLLNSDKINKICSKNMQY